MRSRQLPPLYPLRAFDAASRHLSFTEAANEIGLTQSAVSHQVKKLEDYLGVKLFRRRGSSIALTAEGEHLARISGDAFSALARVSDAVPDFRLIDSVTVSSPPLLFSWWLTPRIEAFMNAYPNIRFHFKPGGCDPDQPVGEVDVALYWGTGVPLGFSGEKFLSVAYSPVASPSLINLNHRGFDVAELQSHRILHEVSYTPWTEWAELAGIRDFFPRDAWLFDDPGMMIEAAIKGKGVALAPVPIISDLIEAGDLIRVSEMELMTDCAYYICCSNTAARKPAVKVFSEWVREQVGQFRMT